MSTIYVVVLTYIKPLEAVDRAIPAHIEWFKNGYADGLFLALPAAGSRRDEASNPRCSRLKDPQPYFHWINEPAE